MADIIQVNDSVKSFDFPGKDNKSYIIGIVEEIRKFPEFSEFGYCPRYKIRVTHQILDGVEVDLDMDYVYPPVNGLPTSTGKKTNGVVAIRQ